jgi:hypothetical protein
MAACAVRGASGRFALHVGKLKAQRRGASLFELIGNGSHERMRHAGPGAVREHIAGARSGRHLQQPGNGRRAFDVDLYRNGVAHACRSSSHSASLNEPLKWSKCSSMSSVPK